ncbi:MAG: hypothetical protein Q9225_003358 [Loekoesia sp. 1 TL-2023]
MTQLATDAIKRIAIIGAGPSGLTTAKYLLAEYKSFDITIFEQRSSVGGLWHYTPLLHKAKSRLDGLTNGSTDSATDLITCNIPKFNTPMYEDLESNLPLMVMQFSDTPFPNQTQLFAKQETVLEYIRGYAEEIRSMIKLEHCVEDVRQAGSGWEVSVKAKGESTARKEQFDAVVVAVNGHTDWPLLPPVEGLDEWSEAYPDSIFHSRTLLVGVGPSGSDISRQIGSVSIHPLLVAQREISPYYTPEPFTKELPGLVSLSPSTRSATFSDGRTEHDINAIMFCTGYAYTFPFLASLAPKIEEEPLYQYIFRMESPTLALMEMNEKIVPFPFAECQAAVLARVWSGRLSLPSRSEMEQWGEKVIEERGVGRGFYALDPPLDLQYMNEMHEWCCKAKKNGETGGKMPKYWDKKEWWEREMAAEMKKAFNRQGEKRHEVRSYDKLGFRFE